MSKINRIKTLMDSGREKLLTVYFTAGFPQLSDTRTILKELQESGADMVEIGLPYSDPVADGNTIQESNSTALENGMSIHRLFEQLESMSAEIHIPVILMGYFNPILQFGVEHFCMHCNKMGIDGLIIPDLPPEIYKKQYKEIFKQNNLFNILMITPQTTEERIRMIDTTENGFIYMVSSDGITGEDKEINNVQTDYFERIRSMNLNNQVLIGFGISDREQFNIACNYARGAIIGSAFIKALKNHTDPIEAVHKFIRSIKD